MLDSETNCAGQPARGGKMICAAVDCVNLIDAHQPLFFLGSDLFVIKWPVSVCMQLHCFRVGGLVQSEMPFYRPQLQPVVI